MKDRKNTKQQFFKSLLNDKKQASKILFGGATIPLLTQSCDSPFKSTDNTTSEKVINVAEIEVNEEMISEVQQEKSAAQDDNVWLEDYQTAKDDINVDLNENEDIANSEEINNEFEFSFKDAFINARNEMGPYGEFEWRGSKYNTLLKEELSTYISDSYDNHDGIPVDDYKSQIDGNSEYIGVSNESQSESIDYETKEEPEFIESSPESIVIENDSETQSELRPNNKLKNEEWFITEENTYDDRVDENLNSINQDSYEIDESNSGHFASEEDKTITNDEFHSIEFDNENNIESNIGLVENDAKERYKEDNDEATEALISLEEIDDKLLDSNDDGIIDVESESLNHIDPNSSSITLDSHNDGIIDDSQEFYSYSGKDLDKDADGIIDHGFEVMDSSTLNLDTNNDGIIEVNQQDYNSAQKYNDLDDELDSDTDGIIDQNSETYIIDDLIYNFDQSDLLFDSVDICFFS